ncbi:hypothetical protein PAHAL_9G264400 [Panicum hallii]|uniref:Uncharacterized protein n=1 Tax=Panicum hallii TaxID=206008 RepID=A0A2S3IMK3_9POAL|nr:hypothetical protein PAHAL_9G264400 [Panicum hallii]
MICHFAIRVQQATNPKKEGEACQAQIGYDWKHWLVLNRRQLAQKKDEDQKSSSLTTLGSLRIIIRNQLKREGSGKHAFCTRAAHWRKGPNSKMPLFCQHHQACSTLQWMCHPYSIPQNILVLSI